jgi:hypothetical protein
VALAVIVNAFCRTAEPQNREPQNQELTLHEDPVKPQYFAAQAKLAENRRTKN